jgi:hypothetical protein
MLLQERACNSSCYGATQLKDNFEFIRTNIGSGNNDNNTYTYRWLLEHCMEAGCQ